MVRTFLKVYMELGFYFLFLQEQIKDIIINKRRMMLVYVTKVTLWSVCPSLKRFRKQ